MAADPNILYVENQPFFADEELLKSAGIGYELAETAAQAVDKLSKTTYSAVLLDIMLDSGDKNLIPNNVPPYMGGVTVLRMILENQFKQAGNGKDLPVVVYTAVGLEEVKEVVMKMLGSYANTRYLEKPESFIKVLDVLKQGIKKRTEG